MRPLLLLVATLQAGPAAQSPQLRLALQCLPSGDLSTTIHNEGSADTAVILGGVLGNGAKYMVSDLRLLIRSEGQPDSYRMYRPAHYPVRIGGRLDDWIVPLPVGASYGLQLQVSDFQGWRGLTSFPPSTLAVRLAVRGPSPSSSPDVRLFRVWTDDDAPLSNQVDVPEDCR